MPLWIARYCTINDSGSHQIRADTADRALLLAKDFYQQHSDEIGFRNVGRHEPLYRLEITDVNDRLYDSWVSPEFSLHSAAPHMRDALKEAEVVLVQLYGENEDYPGLMLALAGVQMALQEAEELPEPPREPDRDRGMDFDR